MTGRNLDAWIAICNRLALIRLRHFRCSGSTPRHLMCEKVDALVTVEEVRALAQRLPRSYEALVGGRVKFRVGRIVYLSFSRDQTEMGFAFPKEQREWLIGG